MGSPTFAKVRPAERQQAIDVIVSAFAGDPFVRNLYPDDDSYMLHFPGAVVAFGGLALDAGTVWRIGEFDGVAFWYPPDLSPDDAIIEHFRLTVSAERLDDIFSTFDQMDHAHPTYRHWYLPWFGVHVSKQGRGIGGDLLRRCLEVVDADHLPAYLENTNPRNRSFYERGGFEVTGESQAGVAPPIFSMVREAR